MQRRVELPSALVLLGALILLISLFVSWWAESNAWEAFEALDLVLLFLAGAAALAALGRLGDGDDARPALALALAVLVIVVVQLIEPPRGFGDDEKEAGIWMALVAGLLMTAGAGMMLASIDVTVDVRGRERRPRVPAVDRRETAATTAAPTTPTPPSSLLADDLPRADEVADDERTQPMRPLPPDDPRT